MKLIQPSLRDVAKFYEARGLVGEGKLSILQTLLAIKKQPFGIESLSGAGKSATLDLLGNHKLHGDKCLLPEGSVYIMGVGSKTAQMYKESEINRASLIYVEELQKAGNSLEITEMLKNLAEGKEFTRDVTDMAGGSVRKQRITKGKGIMYTLALENKHKNDEEMKRRFVVLSTDVGQEQTKRVVARKASERFAKERLVEISDEEIEALKKHVSGCLNLSDISFQNPYAEVITSFMPTPDQKVRSFVSHYFNVMDAVALYHYKDRVMREDAKGKTELYITIQDAYLANLLYADYFTMDIHSIPPLGHEVLRAFNEIDYQNTLGAEQARKVVDLTSFADNEENIEHNWATVSDIHNHLKTKNNIVLKHGVTRDTCNDLYEAGFLERKTGTGIMNAYRLADIPDSLKNKINWKLVYEKGTALMKEHRPELYNEWDNTQKLKITNPLTGEEINILENKETPTKLEVITKPQEAQIILEDLDDEESGHQWEDTKGIEILEE